MSEMAFFNPVDLIREVEKRPGLYNNELPAERDEKLAMWKEVGAAIFSDWSTYNKATAYDKVLQLQRKWRSLRDAYNRELRSRRTGVRTNRKVYKYFRQMSFLGGFEGSLSEEDNTADTPDVAEEELEETVAVPEPPAKKVKVKKPRKKPVKRRSTSESDNPPEEVEMSVFPLEISTSEADNDSDRLFLLSFLPEIRQLPANLKMWARARIASIMQEAVHCHYNNTEPGSPDKNGLEIKRTRYHSNEES